MSYSVVYLVSYSVAYSVVKYSVACRSYFIVAAGAFVGTIGWRGSTEGVLRLTSCTALLSHILKQHVKTLKPTPGFTFHSEITNPGGVGLRRLERRQGGPCSAVSYATVMEGARIWASCVPT